MEETGSISRPDVSVQISQRIPKAMYIKVKDGEKIIDLPSEANGTLSLRTLKSQIDNATGLKFKADTDTVFKIVDLSRGHFYPPDGTWGDTTYWAIIARAMYIKVKDDNGNVILLPSEDNGTLSLDTLKSHMGNATGLKFKADTETIFKVVMLSGGHFIPPDGTWGDTTYWAIIARAMYIKVKDHDGKITLLPSEDNGTLLLETLISQIPNATGLKFKADTDTLFKAVRLSGGQFFPPEGTWGDKTYWAVFPPAMHKIMNIKVQDAKGDITLCPVEANGLVPLETLTLNMPNLTGLRFKGKTDGVFTGVLLDGGHLYPPEGAWGDRIYLGVFA